MSEQVRAMFADIAANYDRTNTVLSFGIHHLWRRATVRAAGAREGVSVLDCATGTGDLAIAFKKAVGTTGRVVGTDFCAEMLHYAPAKAQAANTAIQFEVADVTNLPYPNNSFDVASISFGIRNVDNPVRGLAEMARVVRPGGKVVVLEFGQPRGLFAAPFNLYSKHVIPVIGKVLAGSRDAYEYLPRTASRFPSGENFLQLMQQTEAFSHSQYKPLTFGIACLYTGTVA